MISLQEWLMHLRDLGTAAGFPLMVAGLGLMFFGWRLWKICVMLSFAALGAWAVAAMVGPCDEQEIYALVGGVVLGAISYWPVNQAIAVLGGLVGCAVLTWSLSQLGMSGGTLKACAAVAFMGATAYAHINRQRIVVLMTALMGSVLVLSALAVWVMAMPSLYGSITSLAAGNGIVVPFLVLVPVVMSCFYQISEVHRLGARI